VAARQTVIGEGTFPEGAVQEMLGVADAEFEAAIANIVASNSRCGCTGKRLHLDERKAISECLERNRSDRGYEQFGMFTLGC
jgi:hypothetical protein